MNLDTFLIVFGGGVLGAALGPMFSFILCGLFGLVGICMILSGGSDFMLMQVAFGPIWGPHVGGWAAGIAAATYSASYKKNHPSETGRDIGANLLSTSWDVLLVGGIAALVGHALLPILGSIPIINQADVIALDVVITAGLARAIFCREGVFGNKELMKEHGGLLGTKNGEAAWLPWMTRSPQLIMIGLGVGCVAGAFTKGIVLVTDPLVAAGTISASAAYVSGLAIVWAIGAVSLILLQCANPPNMMMPVFHGIGLVASVAYLYTGSILVAAITGLITAFIQELVSRLFLVHGSNHIDPPAMAIAIGVFVLSILFKAEFLNLSSLF